MFSLPNLMTHFGAFQCEILHLFCFVLILERKSIIVSSTNTSPRFPSGTFPIPACGPRPTLSPAGVVLRPAPRASQGPLQVAFPRHFPR